MSTVHVVPLGDSVEHLVPGGLDGHRSEDGCWLAIEADPTVPVVDCPCGPTVELVSNPDGPDGWLLTHHSIDGRERCE